MCYISKNNLLYTVLVFMKISRYRWSFVMPRLQITVSPMMLTNRCSAIQLNRLVTLKVPGCRKLPGNFRRSGIITQIVENAKSGPLGLYNGKSAFVKSGLAFWVTRENVFEGMLC